MSDDTCALVLAGGRGRRFDTEVDKLLTTVDGRSLLERVIGACLDAGAAPTIVTVDPVLDAGARRDVVHALDAPRTGRVMIVDDDPRIAGPVGGIVGGIDAVGTARYCLLVAADLPLLQPRLLQQLAGTARATSAAVVVASDATGTLQPTCSCWDVAALRRATDDATGDGTPQRATTRGPSLRSLIERARRLPGGVKQLAIANDRVDLLDVDVPADLKMARARAATRPRHTP